MTKASGNIVATLALLTMMAAGGNLAWAQSTAKQSSAPVAKSDKEISEITVTRLQTSARQATGRILASPADNKALVDAVRSKNQDTVKAVLQRDGFTAGQIEGATLELNDNTGGKGGAEGIKITITASCCPPRIVIVISR